MEPNSEIIRGVTREDEAPPGLKIGRKFTSSKAPNPYHDIKWEKRDSLISEVDGTVVFKLEGVEVPSEWSQLATDILASKYLRRAGVPTHGHESSLKQVINRIMLALRNNSVGYFATQDDCQAFSDEISYMLSHQYGAFNSPVWFNVGLADAYGIPGGNSNYCWDYASKSIRPAEDSYLRPQASACFIQSVEDDLGSIFDLVRNESRVFKYGSGTGTNFSSLRGRMEKLSGGGTSSGVMSFLEVFDKGAGATKSGGITRRAAKMVILDADHPEIIDFVRWKMREEKKVAALVAGGYSSDFNGDAYHTVSGQNSNNTVRLPDEFMKSLEDGGKWQTIARTSGVVVDEMPAATLWDEIAKSAWSCADPGVQFDGPIQRWNTCKSSGRINATNPCSEFVWLDDTACNLASLNLIKFLRADGDFDCELYSHAARLFVIAQDILVTMSSYPTEKIAQNSNDFRPIGLGYANLGGVLLALGLPYDSDAARAFASSVSALTTGVAYTASAELADALGPFPKFEENADSMVEVLEAHAWAAKGNVDRLPYPPIWLAAIEAWGTALEWQGRNGYRNSQVTVLAPTGTIGLLMDCDTTGVEPEFALVKTKKLSGGGSLKIVNQSVPRALEVLGYTKSAITKVVSYISKNDTIEGALPIKPEDLPVFDCAQAPSPGGRFIDPMGHVKMLAAIQPYISGSISKTVNLPAESTVDEVKRVFLWAWKHDLKCLTVYRDGSKLSQPLNAGVSPQVSGQGIKLQRHRLPQRRRGYTQEAKVAGHKVFLRTGEYEDGTVGEIFIDMNKEGAAMRSLLNCFAVAISLGLQYGVPLEHFVEQFTFTKFEPNGMVAGHPHVKSATSIIDYVFRVLGIEYLGKTELAHVKAPPSDAPENVRNADVAAMQNGSPFCDLCGSLTVRSGTCFTCQTCGTSKGCS
jgi:ribonucleoside-diphosphate reductase alpha chain